MSRRQVYTAEDDIARFAKCKPSAAIEEFIWNGLDAGSDRIEVRLAKTGKEPLIGLQAIEIEDWGEGMPFGDLDSDFGTAGGSRKLKRKTTSDGRLLHGQYGRGRFRFLALGRNARWETVYQKDGHLWSYEVWIAAADPNFFDYSEPQPVDGGHTGTVVRVTNLTDEARSLLLESTHQHLRQQLAFYLTSYPTICIHYDHTDLDVKDTVRCTKDYWLEVPHQGVLRSKLTVVEWVKGIKAESDRILLCDHSGFVLSDMRADEPLKQVNSTAYLSSEQIRQWHNSGHLAFGETFPEIAALAKVARRRLASHVRGRLAEKTRSLVRQWKQEKVYPFRTPARDPSEKAKRRVFDILAAQIHRYHRPFQSATRQSKRLTLELVRQALEANPTALTTILNEVLKLPKRRQEELAELLEQTNLEAIIDASRTVHERLNTIRGFEEILFSDDWRSRLRERTQLHRLLVHELWLFGEEYELDTDDETLRAVLKAHIRHLGREEMAPEIDYTKVQGIEQIPDLMLTRRFRRGGGLFEHLVIELKNPRVKAGKQEVTQVEDVVMSVLAAEPFSKDSDKVRWIFQLLVNDLGDYGKYRIKSSQFQRGCIAKDATHEIWLLEWGDVLHSAKLRYEFFREKLGIEASSERGMEYLKRNYSHLLVGKGMSKRQESEDGKLERKKTG